MSYLEERWWWFHTWLYWRKVVVVSYVVILETIHTLRRRITENYKSERSQDGTPRHAQIRNEIDKITDMFLSLVYDLARKGHILLTEPSVSITDHHVLVMGDCAR